MRSIDAQKRDPVNPRGKGAFMKQRKISRRTVLKGGGAALAGLTVLQVAGPAQAFPGNSGQDEQIPWDDDQADSSRALRHSAGQVLPWVDQPAPNPVPGSVGNLLKWEELDSWHTPTNEFFFVNHYGQPGGLDEAMWRVGIGGLVRHPQSLTLADIKARARHEVDFTLECSGNTGTGLAFFIGGIGNARWGGARLAPLLEESGVLDEGTEVVFWGADRGTVTIRDNAGVVSGGRTGVITPDAGGGSDLTITEQFARSVPLGEALSRHNLLCYEMNGDPLPPEHGFPVRLIAPGWYGVANVKWLTRIEVTDRRHAGRFMARDYVSIREEQRGGETVWTFTTVSHDRLKSAPAKVTRRGNRYTVMGAAWGAPIAAVEVRVDDGPWRRATLSDGPRRGGRSSGYAWRFWTFDWGNPAPGMHRITSRAFDIDGNIQPAPSDQFLASRRTYWESNGHITRRVLIS
jgi:DMSO/TMAO reductase YedYZ molybdopterin-dependent catalytic subunit